MKIRDLRNSVLGVLRKSSVTNFSILAAKRVMNCSRSFDIRDYERNCARFFVLKVLAKN